MKIKLGKYIHDAELEPIMLILTPEDKENIANMLPNCTKFCQYPDNMSDIEVDNFMLTDDV